MALFALIAYMFWTSSRYPALGEKAMMGGAIQLEDPLSFEAHWPVDPEFPLWKKILYTTGNWLHTNRQGMFFGVLMGSLFLTILRYLKKTSFKGSFANSAFGLVLGAPLGVCVNCAAPIAKGMYSGGARAETTLATMISSPTLNIVVLTMLFSILPFYLAVAKIALSIFVILIAIPVICKFLPQNQLQLPEAEQRSCPLPEWESHDESESFLAALKGFAADYVSDLWYIIKLTVPLMILAGFLGATVATLVPIDLLNTLAFGLIGLFIIALVGTFLPVPIAFDVVITGALLAGGLHVGYVMTLLFTLGIFSIYSFFIVAQAISFRAAFLLGVTVMAIGIFAGSGANIWHQHQSKRALELLTGNAPQASMETPPAIPSLQNLKATPKTQQTITKSGKISLERIPYRPRSAPGDKPFTRREAHHFGIDKPVEFSFKDMWPPFWEGRSISAGDFDNDGDPDLVLASTEKGLYFYLNDGAGQFTKQDAALGKIKDMPVFNAALVDLNNDGWLDLFLTTYQQGNFILWNEEGSFDAARMTTVHNRDDAVISLALSFGDVDRDGDLDVALGNWAAGWYRRIPGEESRNRIIYNENGVMTGESFKELPGIPGETLSILLSDLDQNGTIDLLVGNDFEQPDVYYYGDGKGAFTRIRRADNIIPFTTTTTMAVKNNDLNNDLLPEIYIAQIAGRSSDISERLNMRPIELYCSEVEREEDRRVCEKNMAIKTWYKSGNNFDPSYANKCQTLDAAYQAQCRAMLVKDLAIQADDPSICELIDKGQPLAKNYCEIHFRPIRKPNANELADQYPQIKRRNVLLMPQEDGSYKDESVLRGLEVGGWSWDTKIDDFDNDGWPDVYIVNGTWVPNEVTPSNLYFSNDGTGHFSEQSKAFGLVDHLMTAGATKLDIDHDGDLDFITIPVNGPAQIFINNSQSGNAIDFQFRDHIGNHFGIGARILIRYGEAGERRQMREIQSGGGFQSFDASIAHFGLGDFDSVKDVTIYWADGSQSKLETPVMAGATYVIERQAK